MSRPFTVSLTSMLPRVALEYGHTLMCGSHDPRRLLRVLNLRQGHVELYGELETALLRGKQAHPAVD